MNQKTKRRIRTVLQMFGLENAARSVYRRGVQYRLEQRFGNQSEIEITVHNTKVRFATRDLYSKRMFLALQTASYEGAITQILAERMAKSRCFVDVGAHVGYYTCIASKIMRNGTVFAFEMDEDNLALLNQNIILNQCENVIVVQAAVTNVAGEVKYIKDTSKASSGFGLSVDQVRDQKYGTLVTVEGLVLDEYFETRPTTIPDLVKIDVEGAELQVLEGMKNLLDTVKPELFIEVHPEKILAFNTTVDSVVTLLLDAGYVVHEILKTLSAENVHELHLVGRDTRITENSILYAHKS